MPNLTCIAQGPTSVGDIHTIVTDTVDLPVEESWLNWIRARRIVVRLPQQTPLGSRDPISTSITMPFVTLIYRVAASRHSVSRPIKFGLAEIDDPILPTQLLPLASGRGMLMSHRTPSEANSRSTVPPSS